MFKLQDTLLSKYLKIGYRRCCSSDASTAGQVMLGLSLVVCLLARQVRWVDRALESIDGP
jgi:hypothetical protein